MFGDADADESQFELLRPLYPLALRDLGWFGGLGTRASLGGCIAIGAGAGVAFVDTVLVLTAGVEVGVALLPGFQNGLRTLASVAAEALNAEAAAACDHAEEPEVAVRSPPVTPFAI